MGRIVLLGMQGLAKSCKTPFLIFQHTLSFQLPFNCKYGFSDIQCLPLHVNFTFLKIYIPFLLLKWFQLI